jgi:sirohydrochlorin ferrochelatase
MKHAPDTNTVPNTELSKENATAVLIVDHGSKRPEANALLAEVAALYARQTGTRIVEFAHMELAEPTIPQGFARCVERGARHVIVSLFFLSPGRHSAHDIPALAAAAAAEHPGVTYAVAPPLGLDARLIDLLRQRVAEAR